MASGRKNKKSKNRQRSHTSKIADGEPESQRSVTDPPPPLSLSLSGPTATNDNAVDRRNHGDQRRSPGLGSDKHTASSPLPTLTASDHDEEAESARRPSQHSGPAEKSSHISRDTISSTPNRRGTQRATLEVVSDEDDRLPPTPTHGPRSVHENTPSDRYNRLPGSSPMLSSSPYPSGNQPEDNDGSDSLKLHLAATRSLADRRVNDESDASNQPNIWNDHNIKAANEALAHDRSLHESTEVFQRRRAAWERSEQRLRDFRVEDDRLIAEELYIDQLRESQDRKLAEQLQHEQQTLSREREEFETRRRIMEEYIRRERIDLNLAAGQASRIMDQGIDWDDDGKPYEKGPAPSRGSSVGFWVSATHRVSHGAPLPQGAKSGRGASTMHLNKGDTAVKKERESSYYSRLGVNPPKFNGGDSGSGGKPPGRGHGKPEFPSDLSSSTSDEEESHSDESDPTYQPENNYSRSEETDSALEQEPSVTIDKVTLNASGSQPSQGKTRSGHGFWIYRP
ncbi:hypothetical protein DFH09DRAFT_1071990 [Mycena vulgaris]|nr:hypothetical protein DFH09DRAFT_1071990 [Mycena vulgaris]